MWLARLWEYARLSPDPVTRAGRAAHTRQAKTQHSTAAAKYIPMAVEEGDLEIEGGRQIVLPRLLKIVGTLVPLAGTILKHGCAVGPSTISFSIVSRSRLAAECQHDERRVTRLVLPSSERNKRLADRLVLVGFAHGK